MTATVKALPEESEKETRKHSKLVGVKGWLTFFLFGLVVSIAYNFYGSISGFLDTNSFTPQVVSMYPSLPGLVNSENVAQLLFGIVGIYLFRAIAKRTQYAPKFAFIYLMSLLTYTVVDYGIAYNMFYSNQAVLNTISSNSGLGRTLIYCLCWIPYFLVSRRVKATFTADYTEGTGGAVESRSFEKPVRVRPSTRSIPKSLSKEMDNLEKIALRLDKGCREGEISLETVDKAQAYLNHIVDRVMDSKSIGTNASIVYEVQALIHWIRGEEEDAYSLAKSAAFVKKDDILLTQTANRILRLK